VIVQLLKSAVGVSDGDQFLTSILINQQLAFDAGSIGLVLPLSVQKRVRHVFLSHAHLDHVASLPIFLDHVHDPGGEGPQIYGSTHVLETLQQCFFNDVVWPDLIRLSATPGSFLRLQTITPEIPVDVGEMRVTPVALNHAIPTMGFVIEEPGAAVALVLDTGPTQSIWQRIQRTPNIRAVFVETSFPNRLDWLAQKSCHLTPSRLQQEIRNLPPELPVYVQHIKPAYRDEIEREIAALGSPHIQIARAGREYCF
jgi:cAMP phosphodiesterase